MPDNNSTQVSTSLMPLFPTLDSLDAVAELGMSHLPIKNKNALRAILCTYHNTLIAQLQKEAKKD